MMSFVHNPENTNVCPVPQLLYGNDHGERAVMAIFRLPQRGQARPIMSRISATILPDTRGFPKNRLSNGISLLDRFNCPDTRIILIGGHRL